MIEAKFLESNLKKAGFNFYTGVPCSYLKPFINYIIDSTPDDYVIAASEGEAIGIAAGAYLAGKMPVVMFQNSGLGNTVNPLTSLNAISEIPSLIIVTHRGQPDAKKDAAQHKLMGEITSSLLDLMEIPNLIVPTDEDKILEAIQEAKEYIAKTNKPFGLVLQKGTIAPYALQTKSIIKDPVSKTYVERKFEADPKLNRYNVLEKISKFMDQKQLPTVATTGKMSRELFDIKDTDYQFYMVGSMGCAASIGLGLALKKSSSKIMVLDGDGAVLMKMGTLATIGNYKPTNLIHIIIDNGAYETTGGQETISNSVDFLTIGKACGYEVIEFVSKEEEILPAIEKAYNSNQLSMIHIRIQAKAVVSHEVGRPTLTPPEVTQRFRNFIEKL